MVIQIAEFVQTSFPGWFELDCWRRGVGLQSLQHSRPQMRPGIEVLLCDPLSQVSVIAFFFRKSKEIEQKNKKINDLEQQLKKFLKQSGDPHFFKVRIIIC